MGETTIPAADFAEIRALAWRLRRHTLEMTSRAGSSHVGTNFSMAEILAVLYSGVLRVDPARPDWPARDRFVVSKGHGAAAVYAVLAERGFFPLQELETFYANGSRLAGHVTKTVPGVELSTGSLGHGLPVAAGMALAAKHDGTSTRVFCLLSDGECDEGSNWEPILFAPQHRLDNLVVIVDYNKIQSLGSVAEVMELEPFADKWRAFRWAVREVDGHSVEALWEALHAVPAEAGRPTVVIAHTVKGKGVSFMEHQLLWHYRNAKGDELDAARAELEAARP
ncbi:MAG TPA: transketolase [Longimicrobium sp.]|nr:transketolase [Longimicrobium sp.]